MNFSKLNTFIQVKEMQPEPVTKNCKIFSAYHNTSLHVNHLRKKKKDIPNSGIIRQDQNEEPVTKNCKNFFWENMHVICDTNRARDQKLLAEDLWNYALRKKQPLLVT